MLISKDLNAALNEQVGHEFGASLQYVQIAAYFDGEGLPMLARHFYKQAEEEREHAMKFVRFISDADGTLAIPSVPAPKPSFASAEEAVQLSLDWEITVTKQCNALMDRAIRDNNHIAKQFLDWFMEEQLEEVSSMDQLLRMVRRAGESGLLFIENYLQRGGMPAGGVADDD
ncbi:MAG TPA: ferritin [Gemmatimonadaceae bacterium]|nr:ferritin [Gemmatimonadaceae bacterium]